MLSLFQRKVQSTWVQLPADFEMGPLRLHPSGDYSIAFLTFDQACDLKEVGIIDAKVNKKGGEGHVLKIEVENGPTFRFKFESGIWYAQK